MSRHPCVPSYGSQAEILKKSKKLEIFINSSYGSLMNARNHDRSSDNCTLTISLPKEDKAKIKEMAKKENRTVSNFVHTVLLPMMAEDPAKYGAEKKSPSDEVVVTARRSKASYAPKGIRK
jgi:hypothetical protein